MAMFFDIILGHGEVSEWLKEHAWKVCKRLYRFEGSNPSFTAKILKTLIERLRSFFMLNILI